MPLNMKQLAAELARQGGAGGLINDRLDAVIASRKDTGKALNNTESGPPTRLFNNITLRVCILEMETKKGSANGRDYQSTNYKFMILGVGKQQVSPADGRRLSDEELEFVVHCEQPMNPTEQAAFNKRLDDDKVKQSDGRRNRKRREFTLGTATLHKGQLFYSTFWGPAFRDATTKTTLGKGSVCLVRGIRPKQQYKLNLNLVPGSETVHVQEELGEKNYSVKWEISDLARDPNSAGADLVGMWRRIIVENMLPNLSTRNGYGPHNNSSDEMHQIEQWARDNKLGRGTEKWKSIFWSVPQAERALVNSFFVVPLDARDDDIQPWHLVNDRAVQINALRWDPKGWSEQLSDNKKTVLRQGSFRAEVNIFSGGGTEPEKALITAKLISGQLKEKMNLMGIVSPDRWARIASALVPYVGGLIVCKLDLQTTRDLPHNDEATNPVGDDGNYANGVAFGAAFKIEELMPDVARGVVHGGYRINSEAAKFFIRAVFGTDDLAMNPHATATEDAQANPLNKVPGEPVINMLEATKSITALQNEKYIFYLLFHVEKRSVMDQFLKRLKGKTEEERVDEFSRLMMEDELESNFLGMPQPSHTDTNSFGVFAVRSTEVERVQQPPVQLSEADFAAEMLHLQADKEKNAAQRDAQLQAHAEMDAEHIDALAAAGAANDAPASPPHDEQPQQNDDGKDAQPVDEPKHNPKKKKKTTAPVPAPSPAKTKKGRGKRPPPVQQEASQDEPDDEIFI